MPGIHVCNGAQIMCSFCPAPGVLIVPPLNKTLTSNQPAATIMDNKPGVNIAPFPMCMSPKQPSMASVGAPGPCIPLFPAPWSPGAPTVMLGNNPVLNNLSTLNCASMNGVIMILNPGQVTEFVP